MLPCLLPDPHCSCCPAFFLSRSATEESQDVPPPRGSNEGGQTAARKHLWWVAIGMPSCCRITSCGHVEAEVGRVWDPWASYSPVWPLPVLPPDALCRPFTCLKATRCMANAKSRRWRQRSACYSRTVHHTVMGRPWSGVRGSDHRDPHGVSCWGCHLQVRGRSSTTGTSTGRV